MKPRSFFLLILLLFSKPLYATVDAAGNLQKLKDIQSIWIVTPDVVVNESNLKDGSHKNPEYTSLMNGTLHNEIEFLLEKKGYGIISPSNSKAQNSEGSQSESILSGAWTKVKEFMAARDKKFLLKALTVAPLPEAVGSRFNADALLFVAGDTTYDSAGMSAASHGISIAGTVASTLLLGSDASLRFPSNESRIRFVIVSRRTGEVIWYGADFVTNVDFKSRGTIMTIARNILKDLPDAQLHIKSYNRFSKKRSEVLKDVPMPENPILKGG